MGTEDDIRTIFSVLLGTQILVEGKGYANEFLFFPRLLTQNTDEIWGRCFKLETWEELTVAEGYRGHPKTSGSTVSQ